MCDESRFYAERGQRSPARVVEGDPDRIWKVITHLLTTDARSEYLGFDNPANLTQVPLSIKVRGSQTMRSLVDRGVVTRQVTTRLGAQVDDEVWPSLQGRAGGDVRMVDRLPAKVCIVDRRYALVPTDLEVLANGLTVVTDPTVVRYLAALHESYWRSGAAPVLSEGDEPPPHLRSVVTSLASGLPDDRAAQRARMSPRTYARRVAELMRRLGVATRFEAGVEVTRRGWV